MKSYYILLISVIFICALILTSLGVFRYISALFLAILIIFVFGLLILSTKRDFLFTAFLLLLVFLLGVARYNIFNTIDKNNIKNYIYFTKEPVLVQGKVVSDPSRSRNGKKETFILEANSVRLAGNFRKANGLALVNLYGRNTPVYQYGDIVVIEGTLRTPFSYRGQPGFDYRKYLANKRIYSTLNVKKNFLSKKIGEDKKNITRIIRNIYSLRAKLALHIVTSLDYPERSVLTAMLLGKRQKIPSALKDLFAKTGTLHILAISGLHVGIIYFALRAILKIFKMPKNVSIILSILFLVGFTILTGARASILRATTIFSNLAFGEMLKRKTSIFNLIGLSSLMILAVDPNQVFDVGFILSYTAVLSIVCISPFLYGIFPAEKALVSLWRKIGYYLSRSVTVSLAVWLGLLPLIAYYFGLISPVVVIANLVVIPLLFVIMGSGILLVSLGFLTKFLTAVFAQSTWFFLFVLIKAIKFLKDIPLAYFEIKPLPLYVILIYYLVLLIALKCLRGLKKPTFLFLT